ncbi:hypothetical protein ES705_37148 [subsurface metagenome]|nr:exosortase-associated EpsI family protein [Methanosarcinales archaeon]
MPRERGVIVYIQQEKKVGADILIPIIGPLALVFVIIFLLSTPGMILSKSITTIDTELGKATGHEFSVATKMDFGDTEHVRAFPRHIGNWKSMHFNTSRLEKALRADAMLLRVYANPPIPRNSSTLEPAPVSFAIIQSKNVSAFHAPVVCYSGLGYKVEEEATEEIPISNVTWAQPPLYSHWEPEKAGSFNGSVSVKKLVLLKESKDGKVTDREIILYFYVKGNPLTRGPVTVIRAAAHAPINGSYEKELNSTKDFMGEAFPYMFEIREKEEIIAVQLAKSGIGGWLIIGALVSVPVGIIVYPRIKKRNEGSG